MKRFGISVFFAIGSLWAGMAQADMAMAIPNVTGDPAAADIRFRVAYPKGWEQTTFSGKGLMLLFSRKDGSLMEMLTLQVEKMTEAEAAGVFAEKGAMSRQARIEQEQQAVGNLMQLKVLSLEDIRVDGQPAVLMEMEKRFQRDGKAFFQKEMTQVVWGWGRKIIQSYSVMDRAENSKAVVKRYARGERGDPGTFMGSLQILNRNQMARQPAVPEKAAADEPMAMFDSDGHSRAKGAQVKLLLPEKWKRMASPKGNVVEYRSTPVGVLKKSVSLEVTEMTPYMSRAFLPGEGAASEKERKVFLQQFLSNHSPVHDFTVRDTTFKGRTAVMADIAVTASTDNISVYGKMRTLNVYDGRRMITLWCGVIGPDEARLQADSLFADDAAKICRRIFESMEITADAP